MASFTESATLKIVDQASAQIRKINAELKKLGTTMNSLKSKKIDLGLRDSGINKAQADISKLTASISSLKSAAGNINLKVNASGVTQASRQLAQLHTQASKPITTFIKGAAIGAGYAAVRAAEHSVTAGVRTTDVGEMSLGLKALTAEHRKFVDEQISAISKEQAAREGGAMFNRGAITQQMSEMLGTVNIGAAKDEGDFRSRVAQAKLMSDQNLELAQTLVKLGKSAEEAREDSIKYGKAIDLSGQIYDKATGKIDPKKATEAYDQIRMLIPAIGQEMTGSNFLQVMKYLRSSKFALAPESMALAMRNFEEMGTSAAVGLNQMIKNLSRSAKPAQLEEQRRLGLTETKLVPKGRVGHQTMKEVAGDMEESNQKLLREHPQQYIDTRLVPALISDLMKGAKGKPGLTREAAEAKTFDPAYVATEMGKIFSDRTAQEMATLMVLQRNENAQFLKDWASRKDTSTVEGQRAAGRISVLGAATAIGQQMQGVFGEMTRAAAPVLVPALNVVGESMRSFANDIADAQRGDVAAKARLESKAMYAAPAALAAKMGFDVTKGMLGPIGDAINAVASPLGKFSALQAMGSSNEGVRALGASAQAQLSAADAMNAMTQAQAFDKPESWLRDKANQLSKGAGGDVTRLLGTLLGVAADIQKVGIDAEKSRTPEFLQDVEKAKRQKLVDKAIEADSLVQTAQINLANTTEALTKARKAGIKGEIARLTQQEATFRNLLKERQEAYDRANRAAQAPPPADQRPRWMPPMKVEPKKTFGDFLSDAKPIPVYNVTEGRTRQAIRAEGKPKLGQVPVPTADPRKAGGIPAPPSASVELLGKFNENFASNTSAFIRGIGDVKSAFGDLPMKMTEGVKTAANDIESGMTRGAGAAGDIIAGKIRTAASNITVNVNVGSVSSKPDTGGLRATDKTIST